MNAPSFSSDNLKAAWFCFFISQRCIGVKLLVLSSYWEDYIASLIIPTSASTFRLNTAVTGNIYSSSGCSSSSESTCKVIPLSYTTTLPYLYFTLNFFLSCSNSYTLTTSGYSLCSLPDAREPCLVSKLNYFIGPGVAILVLGRLMEV